MLKIEAMRHIAIISQGVIHPSALLRTCNGTRGAIHKVHCSALRPRPFIETKESPERDRGQHVPHPPLHILKHKCFYSCTTCYGTQFEIGESSHISQYFWTPLHLSVMQLTAGKWKVLCHHGLTLPEISQQHQRCCRRDVTTQPPPTAAPRDGLHSNWMRLNRTLQ